MRVAKLGDWIIRRACLLTTYVCCWFSDLYQMSSTIQVNDLAGDVGGTGEEEEQCLLNLLFLCPSPGRDVFGDIWLWLSHLTEAGSHRVPIR